MSSGTNPLFRQLPSLDELLRLPAFNELMAKEGEVAVKESTRIVLNRLRDGIASGKLTENDLTTEKIVFAVREELTLLFSPTLHSVINATGVILHTNLGRAPLSVSALNSIVKIACQYTNIEFDLATGERGKRDVHVAGLFNRLLAPFVAYESRTIVVNNCAAAVLLALNSLADGGEVIVSRGELVEIGGSFRIPDVMAKSGAVLHEVGTTNRTRLADYESAISEKTKLILRVHRSNFAMVGFTEQPALTELVALGKKHNIPVMEDLGNGAIFDLRDVGVHEESGVAASLRASVDVITYSGDKLFGGPQAGLLTGRTDLITRIRSNPLFRALRVDKIFYAALQGTLLDYLRGDLDAIPILHMIRLPAEDIKQRAEILRSKIMEAPGNLKIEIDSGESVIGGGTTPNAVLPTFLLSLAHTSRSADALLAKLRLNDPPIIARVVDDRVLLDLRTVFWQQDERVLKALKEITH